MVVTLLGSTGLVGKEVLRFLEASPSVEKIILPVRKIPSGPVGEKSYPVEIDFENLKLHKNSFLADAVICCLGTTLKKAGSKKAREHVDLQIPLECAAIAKAQKVKHFLVISAQGANAHSPFHYNRTKGLLEEGLKMLEFPSLTIIRPSLLLGKRAESRTAEDLFQKITSKHLHLIPEFWRPVHAKAVAALLVASLSCPPNGPHIIFNRTIAKSDTF
ncbi:MAG: NAD-binding protein [Fibrobacter sp.]|nr:NAD-binding protein [Fibrobacter sp.]